jgi:hypothetical protein
MERSEFGVGLASHSCNLGGGTGQFCWSAPQIVAQLIGPACEILLNALDDGIVHAVRVGVVDEARLDPAPPIKQ